MSFDLIAEVQAKPGRKPAQPTDKHLPIFERIKGRTIKALNISIEQARGRFLGEGTGADPEKAYASPCWKVHKANEENPGQNELVYVGVPCGNKFMPWFKDAEGEVTGQPLIASDQVVGQLEAFLKAMEGLDKGSAKGTEFHEHAIANAEPPAQKGKGAAEKRFQYDSSVDQWVDTEKK